LTGTSQNRVQGRPTGHAYELPPQTSVIRPQLPPSANVYRGGQVSPGQQSHMSPASIQSASTQTTMPGVTPGRIPQGWLNSQPTQSQNSVYSNASQMGQAGMSQGSMLPAGPTTASSGFPGTHAGQGTANNQPYNTSQFPNGGGGNDMTPAQVQQQYGTSTGGNGLAAVNGIWMAQQPHGFHPGQDSPQPGGYQSSLPTNGLASPTTSYGQPNTGQQFAGQPYVGQAPAAPPYNGQPVVGQQYANQAQPGQNPVATSNQQSFGPQYFAPPPLAGPGFSSPGQTAADPLAAYHATRRQLEQDYQRTLNQVNQPVGGNTFQ